MAQNKPVLHIICSGYPSASGKGYQVLAYNRIIALKNNYEVLVLCTTSFFSPLNQGAGSDFNSKIFAISLFDILKNLVLALIKFEPLMSAISTSKSLANFIKKNNDVKTICILSRNYSNLKFLNKGFAIVEFVDSMYLNFSRREGLSSGLLKYIYRYEAAASKRFDTKISSQVKYCTAVSKIDAELIGPNVRSFQLGVALPQIDLCNDRRPVICFTGNMSYPPNLDAIIWFFNHVWRPFKLGESGLFLRVIGRNPPSSLLNLLKDNPTVEVVGYVPSIQKEIARSLIAVAPMVSGSGMQFKVLEAMAVGTPVICSRVGLGDIQAVDKKDVLIAETGEDYVSAIFNLRTNSELWNKLSRNGRRFVSNKHNWIVINQEFSKFASLID